MQNNNEFKYEVIVDYGILSESSTGWEKRLKKISWNNKSPKYDIRDWSKDGTKMSKGITLSEEEMINLIEILKKIK